METRLTAEEVAERAGVSVAFVRELDAARVIDDEGDRYPEYAVRVAMLTSGCVEAGLPLDVIGKALESGHLTFAALRSSPYERWGERRPETWGDVARDEEMPFPFLQQIHEVIGFGVPQPEDHPRGNDRALMSAIGVARRAGFGDGGLLRLVRVYGESIRRVARTETELWHEFIDVPLERAGSSQRDILESGADFGAVVMAAVDSSLLSVYHRMQEHAWMDDLIEHVELALVEAGAYSKPERPTTMAFMDISGYTALTEERGDQAAAELASRLASIVQRTAVTHSGEAMKWLGDGVMFRFHDVIGGVLGSIEVVEESAKAGLPSAHVGLHLGAVVERDGDLFGRTVNLASRISTVAEPGDVLVTREVAEASASSDAVRFDPFGSRELKGVAAPIELFRAQRV